MSPTCSKLGHQFRLQEANMEISHKISHNLWIWLFYYIQIHQFCFAFEPQIKPRKKTFNHFHLRFPWSVFFMWRKIWPSGASRRVPWEHPPTFSKRWDTHSIIVSGCDYHGWEKSPDPPLLRREGALPPTAAEGSFIFIRIHLSITLQTKMWAFI